MNMNPSEFREKFKIYLDDVDRYRKFVRLLNRGKENRLLYWQEKVMNSFCEKYTIEFPSSEHLKVIFAICELHNEPLKHGTVKVFAGHIDYSREYDNACAEKFPNSYMSEINGPKELYGKYIDINFCSACREAEKQWKQKNA